MRQPIPPELAAVKFQCQHCGSPVVITSVNHKTGVRLKCSGCAAVYKMKIEAAEAIVPITFKSKMPLAEAATIAEWLKHNLFALGAVRVQIAGSIRRGAPEIGDIDIIVEAANWPEPLTKLPGVEWVEGGDRKATLRYQGKQINVLRSDEDSWGAALFYFTGPSHYVVGYRVRAKKMGMTLNEYGLFRDGVNIASRREEDIYTALDKTYKQPHLRGE